MSGKAILVVGASSGIGAAAARVFCAEGASVVLAARSADKLDEVEQQLVEDGFDATARVCDIAEADDVQAAVDATLARHGRIDGAFNNAGVGHAGRLVDLTEEQYDEIMRVNLRGIWLALRAQIRAMIDDGRPGSIVNTSSVGGLRGGPGLGAYPATKRGVIGLTTTAARTSTAAPECGSTRSRPAPQTHR